MGRFLLIIIATFISTSAFSQAQITGKIVDVQNEQPIAYVTIYIKGTQVVTETTDNGRYAIDIPANKVCELIYTRTGYQEVIVPIEAMPDGTFRQIDLSLATIDSGVEVIVRDSKIHEAGKVRENIRQLKQLPSATGNLESVLPAIALGLSTGSGGDLSSQYNVRGGSYDENLVYVNDFEIYRPQLIRAGQQEGLTFANIDLIRDLTFSSGGFEASYGDKLSSVLDIRYKRPDSLRGSASVSLLGGAAHVEGSRALKNSNYRKFRYLVGARYKTTKYLLGSLDVKGEYQPNFTDVQTYLTYDINYDWQLGLLANFNRSIYQFRPTTRSTALGLINFALQLYSEFEGQEVDDFTTGMGGLSLTYLPERTHNPFYLKFLASGFSSIENERIDIEGVYSLREIETGLGADNFGEVIGELGAGTQHQFVRNSLDLKVYNFQHKGGYEYQLDTDDEVTASHFIRWGANFKTEGINDWINEWERLDSAGYTLPFDTSAVLLQSVLKTKNELQSSKFTSYLQDTYTWRKEDDHELRLLAGLRASYWSYNQEFNLSPRVQLTYKPLKGNMDVSYRLASGVYIQQPVYRDLRQRDGVLNQDILAQKSAHFLAGMTYDFYLGRNYPKKFRLITELYYKKLWDLISFDLDNVRVDYSGKNDATGYVGGIDLRLNGEFVPGVESWVNLSFLSAKERLTGVEHLKRERGDSTGVPTKYVSRPTDQLFTFSMFFQDYLRNNKNIRVSLNIVLGSGLPFGLKDDNIVYRNTYRLSSYHRVDLAFSFALWDESRRSKHPHHLLRFTRNSWLSLEFFNLLQVQNQAGNTWIKTIFNQQYAIPNYLTSRRINLKLKMDF